MQRWLHPPPHDKACNSYTRRVGRAKHELRVGSVNRRAGGPSLRQVRTSRRHGQQRGEQLVAVTLGCCQRNDRQQLDLCRLVSGVGCESVVLCCGHVATHTSGKRSCVGRVRCFGQEVAAAAVPDPRPPFRPAGGIVVPISGSRIIKSWPRTHLER